MATYRLGSRTVKTSNEDKVLFPDAGLTKGDLIAYYRRIANTLLPHIRGRPLTLHRYPDGIDTDGFYQKQKPDYFPVWFETVKVSKSGGGTQTQVVAGSVASLVYLADQACLTPHIWLSRTDRLDRPDRLIFDLDPPPEGSFGDLVDAARWLRDLLGRVDLPAYVQTTGSRGLHVVVPLDRSAGYDPARDLAEDVARRLARAHPDKLTTKQRKAKRGNRTYLDVMRNAYGQTVMAPYSVRARPGAPVATPLDWSELGRSDLGPRSYTIENIFRRLGNKEDPWRAMGRHARSVHTARRKLQGLKD